MSEIPDPDAPGAQPDPSCATPLGSAPRASEPPRKRGMSEDTARLRVEVEWADITKASGNIFVVGHYIDVLPQNAEWALDCALSGISTGARGPTGTKDDSRLLLTDLTKRGAIRGSLGDILFFPWNGHGQIVLAGMGRLGTFKEPQLRILARSLAQTVGRVLKGANICTVLIGAGFGNLKIGESVAGFLSGFAEALAADPTLDIATLRIVESKIDRVYQILKCAQSAVPLIKREHGIPVHVEPEVVERDGAGGVIPIPFGFSWMLAALAQAGHDGAGSRLHNNLETLVAELPETLRPFVMASLARLGDDRNPRRLALAFRLGIETDNVESPLADRMSFSHDGTFVRSAAITNMTTVAARDLDVPFDWVDRIVEELQAPPLSVASKLATKAFRYLVHPDLKGQMQTKGPLVLELDRTMARVPWEIVHDGAHASEPLGVLRPVARQLRTAYSPRIGDVAARSRLKALVIGDPDDSLDYARAEAQQVAEILRKKMIHVELRLGAPDGLGLGNDADLYDVVALLQSGEFDLVHFCGHAVFYPAYPERSGWKFFKDALLAPSKLEGVERPPRFIFANACVSARLAEAPGTGVPSNNGTGSALQSSPPRLTAGRPPGDSRLVASLADEFFRRGVEDYIGTAWEVPEVPAKIFAERFYAALLGDSGRPPQTLGEAVQTARRSLFDRREEWPDEFGTVWASYQHYGDPTRRIFDQAAHR